MICSYWNFKQQTKNMQHYKIHLNIHLISLKKKTWTTVLFTDPYPFLRVVNSLRFILFFIHSSYFYIITCINNNDMFLIHVILYQNLCRKVYFKNWIYLAKLFNNFNHFVCTSLCRKFYLLPERLILNFFYDIINLFILLKIIISRTIKCIILIKASL